MSSTIPFSFSVRTEPRTPSLQVLPGAPESFGVSVWDPADNALRVEPVDPSSAPLTASCPGGLSTRLGVPAGHDRWVMLPEYGQADALAREQLWEWLSAPFPELSVGGRSWEVLAISGAEVAAPGGEEIVSVARLLRWAGQLWVAQAPEELSRPLGTARTDDVMDGGAGATGPSGEAPGGQVPGRALQLQIDTALPGWLQGTTGIVCVLQGISSREAGPGMRTCNCDKNP